MQTRLISTRAFRVFACAVAVLLAATTSPSFAGSFSYDLGPGCTTMTVSRRTITCNDGTTIGLDISVMRACPLFSLVPHGADYALDCATPNVTGLWWREEENGRGTWVSHQGDTLFAVDYTYDALGIPRWHTLIGAKTADGSFAGNVLTTGGPSFSAMTFEARNVWSYPVGPGWIIVDDADHLRANFADGSVRALVRQQFGPLPTCSFASSVDPATSTNYTDLWWNPTESGWGVNLAHQGDTIFAAWFTYGLDGSPLWLVATTTKSAPGTYTGAIYRAVGPAGPAMQATAVGNATFTFADGNSATFAYSVQLAGMPAASAGMKSITREIFTSPGTTCQ